MLNSDQQKAHDGILQLVKQNIVKDVCDNVYISQMLGGNISNDDISVKDKTAILTGAAGTGKTYTISHIIQTLIDNNYSIGVTSTTHKSVAVLRENGYDNAKTIHSWLGLKLQHDYNSGEQVLVPDKQARRDIVDVLIIDEYSMIDKNLMGHIHNAIRQNYTGFVLYVGDHYQLPPVNCDESPVTKFVKKENTFVLDKIVRQKDGCPIIDLATVFRKAIENEKYFNIYKLFDKIKGQWDNIKVYDNTSDWIDAYFSNPDISYITSYTNKAVDNLNSYVRDKLVKDKLGIDDPDYLINGDRLVFTEMYDDGVKQFYNNQVVEVVDVSERLIDDLIICNVVTEDGNFQTVHVDSKDDFEKQLRKLANKAKTADKKDRAMYWKEYFEMKERYASVRYDYANTIHKTQGSTYDRIFINTADSLNKQKFIGDEMLFRLMYVAITRAKNEVHINL